MELGVQNLDNFLKIFLNQSIEIDIYSFFNFTFTFSNPGFTC